MHGKEYRSRSDDLFTELHSTVGNMSGCRCVSDCKSRGHEVDPGQVPYFGGD